MERDKEVTLSGGEPSRPLSAQEVSALKRVGLFVEGHGPRPAKAPDAFDEIFGSSLPTDEARELLHSTIEAIQQRIDERTLLAVSDGKEVRLPVVQFYQAAELPGLRSVLSAIPSSVSPILIARWLDTPDPDLGGVDGNDNVLPPISPRDYLLSELEAGRLLRKARDLASSTAI